MSVPARSVPLLALSFLALFFEIAAIRWIPGSVRLMGYYSNLVLIASFLGLGAGMLLVQSPRRLERWFAPLTTLLVALCHFSPYLVGQRWFAVVSFLGLAVVAVAMVRRSQLHRSRLVWGGVVVTVLFGALLLRAARAPGGILTWLSQGYVAWGGQGGVSISWLFFVPTVFLLTAAVFACIGQLIGRELERFAPLKGYALNLLGSLLGVLAFSFLSYLSTPPPLWFGLTFAGMLPFLVGGEPTRRTANAVPAVILLALSLGLVSVSQGAGREIWSPYYKIEVEPYPEGRQPFGLIVNHSFHQSAYDLADATGTGRWDLPYEIAKPKRVLILGAGTGNDASAALRAGVEHVDVVEIDPVILGLGLDHHPEDPYHHENVDLHVTDARAYLRNSDQRYDLIAFGTLDSHTLFSGLGNVRLDSYVYTAESVVEARDHLTESGVVAVTFSVGRDWIATKLYDIIEHAFGHPPLVFYPEGESSGADHKVFIAGNDQQVLIERSRALGLAPEPFTRSAGVTLPTDDWPHLYIKSKSLANEYVSVILLLALFSVLATRVAVGRAASFDPTFFLLGAGFLLLETKSVTYLALLFGSTWVVNSVVFSAILMTALVSIAVVHIVKPRGVTIPFVALLVVLALILLLEPSRLLVESMALRALIAVAFVGLPVFFSGIVFSTLFARCAHPASALGSNLIGAVIGGLLEYSSLLLGSRLIYLLAIVIYAAAWWTVGRRAKVPQRHTVPGPAPA